MILHGKLRTLRLFFMDGVQLSQGYRTTAKRQFIFITQSPGFPATHLINFDGMNGWNNLNFETTQGGFESGTMYWESSISTTREILCSISLLDKVSQWFVLHRSFFIWGTKKVVAGRVRQVVVLYSNGCLGIGLGRLRTGCLRRVVIL